jgi:hypothetical protein
MMNFETTPELTIALIIVFAYFWVFCPKTVFWNKTHKYLIRMKGFSVYWRGSSCLIEIDCGRHTIQLFTYNHGWFNYFNSSF